MKKFTKHFVAAALASFMLTCAYGTASAATARTTQRQTTCSNASYMSDFIRNESRKFPNRKYWNGGGDSGVTSTPLGTSNVFTSDMMYIQTLSNGSIPTSSTQFYPLNTRDYLSKDVCEGFARKLSSDYYGTKSFLTIWHDNLTVDDIKPGDIVGFQDGGHGHAIFVLSVSGDTITLADCNWCCSNDIRWCAKMKKSYLGKILLITRPIMIGDINFDGVVDKKDKKAFRTYLDEKDEYSQGKIDSFSMSRELRAAIGKYGDINNDGQITETDYIYLSIFVDPAVPSDRYTVSQFFCYAK